MDIKSFRRQYGLELIPVSLSSLTMGKCVWDDGIFGRPKMAKSGMPNSIFLAFADENLITPAQMIIYENSMQSVPLVDAAFAKIDIEFDFEQSADVDIDNRINVTGDFDLKSVKKFAFSNSKGREMPIGVRNEIDTLLEELKEDHWDKYKKKLRKAYMITQLFYADVSISIDVNLQAQFEASVSAADLNASTKTVFERTINYSFPSGNCPFAMLIERIKNF